MGENQTFYQMTLQDFINKYNGKKVDFDGHYGAQCMDLYRFYIKEVWEKLQTPGVTGAYQVFNRLPIDYEKVKYAPGLMPKRGDVITWDQKYTKNGHIGIVVDSTSKTFGGFEQNNPIGSYCRLATHSYKHIIGWFRPKLAPNPTPMPIKFPVPLITTQPWIAPQVEEARQMILQASDNRLDIQVSITQKSFPDIPFTDGRVDDAWYRQNISPAIAFHMKNSEWKAADQGWHTQDGIHFRADEGETMFFPASNVTVKVFVANFVHELCHRFFYLTGQPDLTHQYMFVAQGIFDPRGAYSKLDYSKLTQQGAKEMIVQKQGEGTLYLFGEGKLFPIAADYPTYQNQFGNTPIAVLGAAEFAKYPVSTLKLKP